MLHWELSQFGTQSDEFKVLFSAFFTHFFQFFNFFPIFYTSIFLASVLFSGEIHSECTSLHNLGFHQNMDVAWLLGFWVCSFFVSGFQPSQPRVNLKWKHIFVSLNQTHHDKKLTALIVTWKRAFPLPGCFSLTSSFHLKNASSSTTSVSYNNTNMRSNIPTKQVWLSVRKDMCASNSLSSYWYSLRGISNHGLSFRNYCYIFSITNRVMKISLHRK